MTQELKSFINPVERRYNVWPIVLPWVVVVVLLAGVWWISSKTQIACRFKGEIMTPAAFAAGSTAGIEVDDSPEKKTTPLAKTPAYGPTK